MNKGDHRRAIVVLVGLALMISLASTTIILTKTFDIGDDWLLISGAQTTSIDASGNTSIEILANVGISIVEGDINLGSGYVDSRFGFAVIDTFNSAGELNWLNSSGSATDVEQYHLIRNTGSTPVVLYVSENSGFSNAEEWLCGDSIRCPSIVADLKVLAKEHEVGSCTGWLRDTVFGNLMSYASRSGTVELCSNLNPVDSSDELRVYYKVVIPVEAPTGTKTLNLIYTAVQVTS